MKTNVPNGRIRPSSAEDDYYNMLNGEIDVSNLNNSDILGQYFDDDPLRDFRHQDKQGQAEYPREIFFVIYVSCIIEDHKDDNTDGKNML